MFTSLEAVHEQISFLVILATQQSNTTRQGRNNGLSGTTSRRMPVIEAAAIAVDNLANVYVTGISEDPAAIVII